LERTKEPARVVGLQGWKTETSSLEPKIVQPSHEKVVQSSNERRIQPGHEDVWDHFWGQTTAEKRSLSGFTPATQGNETYTSTDTSSITPIHSKTATPVFPKYHPSLPKANFVEPGRSADIVLKKDQGTSRTVSGVISEVLTRGDHPWGIKVRLTDGQVGRVQRVH
jgi:uncharacterized repeat protein (TIGR03833 family)